MNTKGYKAMNSNMKCRDFQFKVGKTYSTDSLLMCSSGFHFCENILDVYNYYEKSSDTVVCEVEALGQVLKEGDKSCTDKIKIVKQLTEKELLEVWITRSNSGYGNSGYGNSGNRNSGDGNSGDGNSGNGNSGYFNTTIPLYFFNKPSELIYSPELERKIRSLNVKPIVEWVGTSIMSEEEKINKKDAEKLGLI